MSNFKDLAGKRFGRLLVVKSSGQTNSRNYIWECICDCGNKKLVKSNNLVQKKTQSCGCYFLEVLRNRTLTEEQVKTLREVNTTHGLTYTPFYNVYCTMRARCNNPNHIGWAVYGGRGIKCAWDNFLDFRNDMYKGYLSHVATNGLRNTTIDRIDINGNYTKENCRWATYKSQMRNKRNNVVIKYNGKTACISAWADELGMPATMLRKRIADGWNVEKAFTTQKMVNQFR